MWVPYPGTGFTLQLAQKLVFIAPSIQFALMEVVVFTPGLIRRYFRPSFGNQRSTVTFEALLIVPVTGATRAVLVDSDFSTTFFPARSRVPLETFSTVYK